ncbi:uncharacterized protein MONOS_16432c1 [Monocercomonoides exilis]|uniref:uncharacterized protein n=1 Tax=Monocercomonoides exilis TaxID=2049356 RepID=UPI00355A55A9|nr:hypothetical protein MONOS_16432c2 [Monocercomonoides exilis]KAH7814726.1 hypothetical protein MONOS_16432c1 [Monocercomonoides exilis]|eukprot:MONOS_16432.1-p1 / transcript=MONOS_16432.1 / gene=MONOS_16432 / organism=Monocercomonoides_exilis_PA203 / gene_product=unspecified product / transcript_product=unspecified product / location=Mono_scaffold01731:2936-3370(+) / protein_length=129 / sequence_SO=supercontig / SO=protein_coding / is_pseudo=false
MRARSTGYPSNLFSFHSLRSGFKCSALLATVVGWVPNSAVQQRYAKNAISAAIVANRVGNPEAEGGEVVEKALLNPEVFHNIKFADEWDGGVSDRFATKGVRRLFRKRMKVDMVFGVDEKQTRKKQDY